VNSRVHTRTNARATWHRANTAVCTYMGDWTCDPELTLCHKKQIPWKKHWQCQDKKK